MIVSKKTIERLGKKGNYLAQISDDSNFTFFQFCKCWMDKRCSGIRSRPTQNDELKCWTYASQETDSVQECQSLKGMEKFCYLGHAIDLVQNADYISLVCVVSGYMGVRCGQLKETM